MTEEDDLTRGCSFCNSRPKCGIYGSCASTSCSCGGGSTGSGVTGPTGPTGATGPASVAGGTIQGSYPSLAALQAAIPTGTAGSIYYVAPDYYAWNPTTNAWENVGTIVGQPGATGTTGATGPAGPAAVAGGTILGSYASLAELQAAVPTGTAGSLYYVAPNYYAWNPTTSSWQDVGTIVGQPGPTGATGPAGGGTATGGMLVNVVSVMHSQTVPLNAGDDLKFTTNTPNALDITVTPGSAIVNLDVIGGGTGGGGATGATGPTGATGVGITGPTGATGSAGVQGAQGITGSDGAQGVQGVAGTVGSIKGSYDTVAALQAAHPTGAAGDAYYVSPDMYIWDDTNGVWSNVGTIQGPQGVQGIQGNTGAQGLQGVTGAAGTNGTAGTAGATGPTGPTGATGVGVTGPTGPTGATGPAGSSATVGRIYGTFIGFQDIPLSGGSTSKGVIAPVTEAVAVSSTGDFTVNSDGTVTITNSGLYLATGKVQVNSTGCGQAFALQLNGNGGNTNDYNAFAVGGNDNFAGVTTILHVNAGDKISNSFLSGGPIQLTPRPTGMVEQTPSSAITLLKIGEL